MYKWLGCLWRTELERDTQMSTRGMNQIYWLLVSFYCCFLPSLKHCTFWFPSWNMCQPTGDPIFRVLGFMTINIHQALSWDIRPSRGYWRSPLEEHRAYWRLAVFHHSKVNQRPSCSLWRFSINWNCMSLLRGAFPMLTNKGMSSLINEVPIVNSILEDSGTEKDQFLHSRRENHFCAQKKMSNKRKSTNFACFLKQIIALCSKFLPTSIFPCGSETFNNGNSSLICRALIDGVNEKDLHRTLQVRIAFFSH